MQFSTTSTTWVSIRDLAFTLATSDDRFGYAFAGTFAPIGSEPVTISVIVSVNGEHVPHTLRHYAIPDGIAKHGWVWELEAPTANLEIQMHWRVESGVGVQVLNPSIVASEFAY
jgi:hypothetical protein